MPLPAPPNRPAARRPAHPLRPWLLAAALAGLGLAGCNLVHGGAAATNGGSAAAAGITLPLPGDH